jgi:hypothetical protein
MGLVAVGAQPSANTRKMELLTWRLAAVVVRERFGCRLISRASRSFRQRSRRSFLSAGRRDPCLHRRLRPVTRQNMSALDIPILHSVESLPQHPEVHAYPELEDAIEEVTTGA